MIDEIRNIDISINYDLLKEQKTKIALPKFQKELKKTNKELNVGRNIYSELKDIGRGKKIYVNEYIRRNPKILESYRIREVSRYGLNWIEQTLKNSEFEKIFLSQTQEIYGDLFGELFQSVFIQEGGNKKYLATSGKADFVNSSDIYNSIPSNELENLRNESKLVLLIHNHPDVLSKMKIYEKRNGPTEGFISTGSLSYQDIIFGDKIYSELLNQQVPTFMIAINENGLTHYYRTGTSKEQKNIPFFSYKK